MTRGRGRGARGGGGRQQQQSHMSEEEKALSLLPRSMRNQAAKARAIEELRQSNEFLNVARSEAARRDRKQQVMVARRDSIIEADKNEAAPTRR